MRAVIYPCILDCARFVPERGQNIHLPLSKKKQAGLEIGCFECALKELYALYIRIGKIDELIPLLNAWIDTNSDRW